MQTRKLKIPGGNGRYWYQGIFAFTGTGTTASITVPIEKIESIQLTPIGAASATEGPLSCTNTVTGTAGTDDARIVGSNGQTTLTIARADGTLSGRKFSILVIGYGV